MQIPMTLILIKEVTIKGSFRYGVEFPLYFNTKTCRLTPHPPAR